MKAELLGGDEVRTSKVAKICIIIQAIENPLLQHNLAAMTCSSLHLLTKGLLYFQKVIYKSTAKEQI